MLDVIGQSREKQTHTHTQIGYPLIETKTLYAMETFSSVQTDTSKTAAETRPPITLQGYIQYVKRTFHNGEAPYLCLSLRNKSSLLPDVIHLLFMYSITLFPHSRMKCIKPLGKHNSKWTYFPC